MEKERKFLPLINIIISIFMAGKSVRACVLGSRAFAQTLNSSTGKNFAGEEAGKNLFNPNIEASRKEGG